MFRTLRRPLVVAPCAAAVALAVGAFAFAQESKAPESKPQEGKLPAGWTEADMQACTAAATPGPMHEKLMKLVGTWSGTEQMWMAPGVEPTKSETTWTNTSLLDGRFLKTEVQGDTPGMGPFHGLGFSGFDNVSQKYVSNWLDNMSTGIMQGVGEISPDGRTVTWRYTYNCPLTKGATEMREILKLTSDNTLAVEMYCPDPKTGKEFKCMQMDLKKGASRS